jgi:acyl carrier protein
MTYPIRAESEVLSDVLTIVKDLTSEFEFEFSGAIGPDSFFVADLDFKSTDVVELVVVLETHFQRRKLPFQNLVLKNGKYADFSVRELAAFLHKQLSS